ncbi:MAG: multidrug effflux MFS transporter [Proteobacteria bacterium]|nr:multidrug effflux MFS transporter [Pseudomonadota bacterium]
MPRKPNFLILLLLISFASVMAVFFTPALPEITDYFHITPDAAQFTVTLYLLGYALGQLPYGPLSNAWGRKPTLYFAIALELMGAIICILSGPLHSFWLLNIGRFLTAIGASAGLVMSFTLIHDCYSVDESRRMVSYAIMGFAIMPGVSVALGGLLVQHFGWQGCFYFPVFYGLFLLGLVSFLPETLKPESKQTLNLTQSLKNYSVLLKDKILMRYALTMGVSGAIVYSYNAQAPFLGIDTMKLSPEIFGLFNLLPSLGFFLGSFCSAQISKHFKAHDALKIGLSFIFLGITAMVLFFVNHWINPYGFFISSTVVFFGLTFMFSNASSLATGHITDKSNASGMMNFINVSFCFLGVLLLQAIHSENILTLPLLLVTFFVMMAYLARAFTRSEGTLEKTS